MLPALIGAAKTASTVKSATKLLPDRSGKKQGGALVKQERPTMAKFVGEVEKKKVEVSSGGSLVLSPTIGQAPKKDTKTSKSISNKITLLYKYFRERNKTDRKKRESERKQEENKKKKEKEERRENFFKGLVKGTADKVLAPVRSIFDQILNAIGLIILGKIGMWAVDNPEIFANIINGIAKAMDIATDIFIGVVDFTGTIINGAYKIIDGFSDWVDGNLGEDVSSMLNDLGPKILNFLNASLIVGGLLIERALSDLKEKDSVDKPGKPGTDKLETKKPTAAERAKNARIRNVQRTQGPEARKIYENALNNGKSPGGAQAAVDRALTKGQIQLRPGADSLSGKGAPKGQIFKHGLGRSITRLGIKMNPAMVQNMKAISKMAKGIRIPIVGPLVTGITEFLGSGNLGKALFIALGTALGELIGTAIPIPVVGTLLGGAVGAFAGDLLYDLIVKRDPRAALKKLKDVAKGIFNTGKAIFEWMKGSFGRFLKGIPKQKVGKYETPLPDIGWMINPLNIIDKVKLVKNSFFPPNKKSAEPNLSEYDKAWEEMQSDGVRPQTPMLSGPRTTAAITKLGSGGGSLKSMTDQDWSDLAYIVSGEAARNTDDEYGVAAAVLNRVADPRYSNTIMGVGTAPGQFEAVYKGLARREPNLAKKLKNNQGKIVEALRTLKGRTDFKGQSMLKHKGIDDVMFNPRGNFYHYPEQRKKSDPTPARIPNHWRKLLGAGSGSFGDGSGGTTTSEQQITPPPARLASVVGTPPSSPSAAAATSIGAGGGGTSLGGGGGMTSPRTGSQGLVPLPIPTAQSGQTLPRSSGAIMRDYGDSNSLNRFYKAQLFGFLYKQG